jgi:hypothetical protein
VVGSDGDVSVGGDGDVEVSYDAVEGGDSDTDGTTRGADFGGKLIGAGLGVGVGARVDLFVDIDVDTVVVAGARDADVAARVVDFEICGRGEVAFDGLIALVLVAYDVI